MRAELLSEIDGYFEEVKVLGRSIDDMGSTTEASAAVQTVTIGAGLALVARALVHLADVIDSKEDWSERSPGCE